MTIRGGDCVSSNIVNEDSRVIKTKKVLYAAMFSLLKKLDFRKITIKEICEEALISRAAFYSHFVDKYDLLKHWMAELWSKDFNSNDTYEQIENAVNYHMNENMVILKHLVNDADNETFYIIFDFILSTINLTVERNDNGEIYPKNIVLSNFYAGGIISYLLWQVKNKFPSDVPPMNKYLYEMLHWLQDWQSK